MVFVTLRLGGGGMEKRIELNLLLDVYGPLLTETRAEVMGLYIEQDMSLQEIAQAMSISRQAVHDAISKAIEQLEDYERKLNILSRSRHIQREVDAALIQLDEVRPYEDSRELLNSAIQKLKNIDVIEG